MMTSTTTPSASASVQRRAPRGARRAGYLFGAAINLALIWLVNVEPGWQWLTFLTDDFARVVGLVTASLLVGAAPDLVYIAYDPAWVKRLGDAITAAFACVILARLWAIFPFDLGTWSGGWETALRIALGFLAVVTGIAVVANLAQSVHLAVEPSPPSDG
jgi:hypothetical protein